MSKHHTLADIIHPGRTGCTLPQLDVPMAELPAEGQMRHELRLPEVSEGQIVRYFTALSKQNYALDDGLYPLGSCTMKYNPKWHEDVVRTPGFAALHPYQTAASVQGALKLMFELQQYLAEITGMDAGCLSPMAGAQGELACALMMKKYFQSRGDRKRQRVLIPDSAHGTNAATAAMGGFEVGVVSSDSEGNVDLVRLKNMMSDDVAFLALTMPTTLGLFDPSIDGIISIVHEAGGFVYGDGANMNALLGQAKFGDMGFDCVHLNLHKTFSTPHGGGGPGAGPICVNADLEDYLPAPVVIQYDEGKYGLSYPDKSIGAIGTFYGNFSVLVKAYAYIRSLGAEGLKAVSENAIINANYIKEKLKKYYVLPYDRPCMHEVVFSGSRQRTKGIRTLDIAKRLLDYGFHPPTVYFPLVVDEAMMIEPTETESKETLDTFVEAMQKIAEEVINDPEILRSAPISTPVGRLDEATAARDPDLRWEG